MILRSEMTWKVQNFYRQLLTLNDSTKRNDLELGNDFKMVGWYDRQIDWEMDLNMKNDLTIDEKPIRIHTQVRKQKQLVSRSIDSNTSLNDHATRSVCVVRQSSRKLKIT